MDITGTNGNDVLFGTPGPDTINGLGGDDVIHGGVGIDSLFGSAGNDVFVENELTLPAERFDGGAGFDTIELHAIPIPLFTAAGLTSNHLFDASALTSIERLVFASEVGDVVHVHMSLSSLVASGLTQLVGGNGADRVFFETTSAGSYTMPNVTLTGWSGVVANSWESPVRVADFLSLRSSAPAGANVVLTASNSLGTFQTLGGGDGNDTLNGSQNPDFLNGGGGTNMLFGNGGNDSLGITNTSVNNGPTTTFSGAGCTFDGGSGTDALTIGGHVDFQGTLLNIEGVNLLPPLTPDFAAVPKQETSVLVLDSSHMAMLPGDAFFTGTGTVEFSPAAGTSLSLAGYVLIPGNSVNFRLLAGDGNGLAFTGSTGSDQIVLSTGGQIANGGDGSDTLDGGSGNDVLDGGSGQDTMGGGPGDDRYLVNQINDLVHELGGEGTDRIQATVGFSLPANVENLVLVGTANLGGVGNSVANVITGNSGNNLIDGGGGIDTMRGLGGNDVYYVGSVGEAVQESLEAGIDTVHASVSYSLPANVENLIQDLAGNIHANGNGLANVITGNVGANLLDGKAGIDQIRGGTGADRLVGGLDRDILFGGVDASADIFLYRNIAESTVGAQRDLIYDFVSGADKIDLRQIDPNSGLAGNQLFAFSTTGPAARSVWAVDIGDHLIIRADVTGDTTADFEFQIMNINVVVANDFLL